MVAMVVVTPAMLRADFTTFSSTVSVTTRVLPETLTASRKALKVLVLMESILIASITTISSACALADRADFMASLLTFLFSV